MKIKTIIRILVIVIIICFIFKAKYIVTDIKNMVAKEYRLAKKFLSKKTDKYSDEQKYSEEIDDYDVVEYKAKNGYQKEYKSRTSRYKSKNNLPRRKNNKTSSYKREEICRKILEDHFDDYFPSVRPNFLKNPKTGRPLELDGYNAGLNIAFEHNGKQHYVYPNIFHKTKEDYLKQVNRDHFKSKRCVELGINLITIPYSVPEKDIKDYILAQL